MRQRYTSLTFFFVSLLLATTAKAQERITLTTPETKPSNTGYGVERVVMNYDDENTLTIDEGRIDVYLRGANGDNIICSYSSTTTPTATTLNNALNKANLSTAYASNATTGTLKQRIYHRLVVMGEAATVCGKSLAGSITGSVP